MEWNSLIFIGESSHDKEMKITRKPSFNDAIQLSLQSPQPTEHSPYQAIPLCNTRKIFIYHNGKNIHITCSQHSLRISVDHGELTEEEVYEVVNSFILKDGERITFLGVFPFCKNRLRKRNKMLISAEEIDPLNDGDEEFAGKT